MIRKNKGMKLSLLHIIRRSFTYHLRDIVYQVLIIMVLTAVVTGSLMTGKSVRKSLLVTSLEKLGNAGVVISSGIRYFDPSLTDRVADKTGIDCTGVLELDGYCQNFTTQQTAPGVKIFAVNDDFFAFQGNDTVIIPKGEVAINERLASYLALEQGDELIIRFNSISELPSDAPFAPGESKTGSVVLTVASILGPATSGNFSLAISQITPLNIFVNRSDLTDAEGKIPRINRLLLSRKHGPTIDEAYNSLAAVIKPEDTGLSLRQVPATGGYELVSDRIFIDQPLEDELAGLNIPSYPVITYLANSITKGDRSTPYSFVSGLGPALYKDIPKGNGIVINDWLANDIVAEVGDTLTLAWYSPDPLNRLTEESGDFIVTRVVQMMGIWADSLLMPEFPGIAGSVSCSAWDAGTEINMDLIRDKDEEYWNRYAGTPKAFINYEKGKEIWGNNYGPATSIRFETDATEPKIVKSLSGFPDPSRSGFVVSDLTAISVKAAKEGVDFSSLFLSLGFFMILSAVILLILIVSAFYESRKNQVSTLFALGFSNRIIEKLLFLESGMIALAGTIPGAFAGVLFNLLIIRALNSVWRGAVQTDALISGFDTMSLIVGFASSLVVILILLKLRSGRFLKKLRQPETGITTVPSAGKNAIITIIFLVVTIILAVLSVTVTGNATDFSYGAGIMTFATLIMLIRQYFIGRHVKGRHSFSNTGHISKSYYLFNSSHAIAPVIFLAAGLFAVVITGANKMSISNNMLERSGGTGGFLLWGETPLPVPGNLTDSQGKITYGLNDPSLGGLTIVQAKRTSGDDASCLNLNHIVSPPLLGLNPGDFIRRGSFSFATTMKGIEGTNPWQTLESRPSDTVIYGIADQTVLQYGLKIKPGDTLAIRAESGRVINLVISAGLNSSVFQGFVLIGMDNFSYFFPSVSGSQVFLADGDPASSDLYISTLSERLRDYGAHFEPAADRLASFFVVANTYLRVFTILSGIGMILGVAGLGLILLRNFNRRRRDFGLMVAEGYSVKTIRRIVLREHILILFAGIVTGVVSALVATRPSLMSDAELPWKTITVMIILVIVTGLTALLLSIRGISRENLIARIRKE